MQSLIVVHVNKITIIYYYAGKVCIICPRYLSLGICDLNCRSHAIKLS